MHPGGRTAADGADIPPGHSTGLDLYQARKRGALGLVQGARLFPFRGGSLGPPPPFLRAWLSGVLGPPPCSLGWGLRLGIWLRARVDHDDVEAPPPFPVWNGLPRGTNRGPVDFA